MSDNGPCNCEQAVRLKVEVERLKTEYNNLTANFIRKHDEFLGEYDRAEAAEARADRYARAIYVLPDRFENGMRDVECIFCGCDSDDWEKHAPGCIKAELDNQESEA